MKTTVPNPLAPLTDVISNSPLTKLAYQGFQYGKSAASVAHKNSIARIRRVVSPPEQEAAPVPPDVFETYRQRYDQLLETDWADAEQGIYPSSLLFDTPWTEIVQTYPQVLLDLPKVWDREKRKDFRGFSEGIQTDDYPQYYAQTFHHQTDGYLSDDSANLYDLQVELLFNGAADPMRRRVLAPLKQALTDSGQFETPAAERSTRVLDIACGTGRTLRMLRGALPEASLFGTDLSPAYLRKANQLLSELAGELPQLLQANAEDLPYLDGYFHGVTCVFMMHELPAPVRQKVINECYRVTRPGGTFIICDSIQAIDSPELEPMMKNFQTLFHEPFYNNYIRDDISARLNDAGFKLVEVQTHFASKYWIAQKS